MKETLYKCDLCGSIEEPEDLYGIYFNHEHFEHRDPAVCNTHICCKCINKIIQLHDLPAKAIEDR